MDTPNHPGDLRDLQRVLAERWPSVELVEREAARYPGPRWPMPPQGVVDERAVRREALLTALRIRQPA